LAGAPGAGSIGTTQGAIQLPAAPLTLSIKVPEMESPPGANPRTLR
jgi:hypothetical protein